MPTKTVEILGFNDELRQTKAGQMRRTMALRIQVFATDTTIDEALRNAAAQLEGCIIEKAVRTPEPGDPTEDC